MKLQYESELYHFGIKGQKWYRRRYQNDDGSLTPAGRARYADQQAKQTARAEKYEAKAAKYAARAAKKEAGFKSKRGLFESRKHYEQRVILKQGKAAGDKAKAAKYNEKALKARRKAEAVTRELTMKIGGKELPKARMTDSNATYYKRVLDSPAFKTTLAKAATQTMKQGKTELRGKMEGLNRAEQKKILKAYGKERKKYLKNSG